VWRERRASFLLLPGRMDDGTPAWQQNTSGKCSMAGGSALLWASSSTSATSKTPPRQRTNYCSTAPMHRCTDVLGLAFHSGIFHQGSSANARSRTRTGSKVIPQESCEAQHRMAVWYYCSESVAGAGAKSSHGWMASHHTKSAALAFGTRR
jgi:hypothetical protein